jgi:hypothetical protein
MGDRGDKTDTCHLPILDSKFTSLADPPIAELGVSTTGVDPAVPSYSVVSGFG